MSMESLLSQSLDYTILRISFTALRCMVFKPQTKHVSRKNIVHDNQTRYATTFFTHLFTKIGFSLLHPFSYCYMKRTAEFTMAALYTVAGFMRQLQVVFFRQRITGLRQIIKFVDGSNINGLDAGLAMAAVNTDAIHILYFGAQNIGIAAFFRRRTVIEHRGLDIHHMAHAGNDGHDSRSVQTILNALDRRHSFAKGRRSI